MQEMLADARNRKYAVGMFDVSDLEMIRAVTEEAENLQSPVILGALAPDLTGGRFDYWLSLAKLAATKAQIPVCIHLDHAENLQQIMQAVNGGFSSVMLDASSMSFEENIKLSAEAANAVKAKGITIEAELGHVGNGWVGSGVSESNNSVNTLTDPETAAEFVARTQVDALAVSIGTAHGVYIKAPALDIERLQKIAAATSIPLVLHGGSGTPEDQLSKAIANGICKINIYSELLAAWNSAMLSELQQQPHMAVWPCVLRQKPDKAMRKVIREKITFFNSAGKA